MEKYTFWSNITGHLADVIGHLAWPVSAIVICVLLKEPIAFLLKEPINNLLKRLSKAKHKDTVFDFTPNGQHPVESPVDNKKSLTEDMIPSDNQGLQKTLEENIDRNLQEKGITSDEQKFELLRNHYAALLLRSGYNEIYQLVFGSQISLLQWLNTKLESIPDTHIDFIYYEDAKSRYPELYKTYSFESYLNFMINSNLIIFEEQGYKITKLGRGFLTYMTENGLNPKKPY